MIYKCKDLIERRKHLWNKKQSVELDKEFITTIAQELVSDSEQGESLRNEINHAPYLLIELFFVIVDKSLQVVPFFLNSVQLSFQDTLLNSIKDYEEGKRDSLSFLVLKGRQQGFTSYITAYQLANTLVKKNFSGFTIADSSDNTNTIFADKCKYLFDSLPDQIKPEQQYNTKTELILKKVNSKWRCSTAQAKGVGRSKTINFFHGSEAAFWTSIPNVMKSLGQALTKDSIRIFESTANGFNEFRTIWTEAERGENNFTPLFYEWWKSTEYQVKLRDEEEKKDIKSILINPKDNFQKKLKWLYDEKGLSLEQIKWYMMKKKDLKEDLDQEFPCTPEEAFISSGISVFNKEILFARLNTLENNKNVLKPIKGYFAYEYINHEIIDKTIKFVESENGYVTIYEFPKTGIPYVIGGDTAEGGLDYNAAHVIDNTNGRQVCVVHKRQPVDIFTKQLYCLGKFYGNKGPETLIGVETNFDLYPVKELTRLGYNKQYVREALDSMGQVVQKFGFNTNSVTRTTIINALIEIVRENSFLLNDIATIKELLSFEEIDGKAQAAAGEHDDLVMSLAITYFIRKQQSTLVNIKTQAPKDILPAELQDDDFDMEGFY